MKTCFFCRGTVESGQIDYMAKRSGSYTLVKNLSAEVCGQCGEVYIDAAASRQIDKAISKAGSSDEHLDVPVVKCG